MNMKLANFVDCLEHIAEFDDGQRDVCQHIHSRISNLIEGYEARWQDLYELWVDVELAYRPLDCGVPPEEVAEEIRNDSRTSVEVYVAYKDELSGEDWFDCAPSIWLAILAADYMADGLFMNTILSHNTEYGDGGEKLAREWFIPIHRSSVFYRAAEALIAAEILKQHTVQVISERRSIAAKGAAAKNKKYLEARNGFIEFYLNKSNLSRAETARRYYRILCDQIAPGERPVYRNEESAIRAFMDALRRAGI